MKKFLFIVLIVIFSGCCGNINTAYATDNNYYYGEFPPTQKAQKYIKKVNAEIDLSSPSKTVPLNFVSKGTLSKGKEISDYKFSQGEVTLYGDSEKLESRTKYARHKENTCYK